MSMLPHVNNVFKSVFYYLRTISRIRKYLSTQTTEILIYAFVTSKLDHCNSLLYNVPRNVIIKVFLSTNLKPTFLRTFTLVIRKIYLILYVFYLNLKLF